MIGSHVRMGSPSTDDLQTLLFRRGIRLEDLDLRADGTVAPTNVRPTVPEDASGPLSLPDGREDVQPIEELGRGGMGVVHRARQRSLRREVALKRAIDPAHGDRDLVREARVLAHVGHPNVVPVHALVRLGEGTDRIGLVMKRISGSAWLERLVPPSPTDHAAFDAYLEEQLDVLVRVGRAMAYAHARGVLHLDLKPENVMVGEHGEVYVLDFGLAVGFGEGAPSWLGDVKEIRGVAGTPGYMAPELAAADARSIGPRTDVYLLGAMLHHVITGAPLHGGETLMEVLGASYLSAPQTYAPDVPVALVSILHRATHFAPEQRHADVVSFVEAIEAFRRQRPADALVRSVRERLSALESGSPASSQDDASLEPDLAECELGLDEARRIAPEHPALAPLERALDDARLDHAWHAASQDKARRVVERFRRRSRGLAPEVRARVDALEQRLDGRERQLRELERLASQFELSLGTAIQGRLPIVLGSLWLAVSLVYAAFTYVDPTRIGYRALAIQAIGMMVVGLPLAWFGRQHFLANRVNFRLYAALGFCAIAVELLFAACFALGLPVRTAIVLTTPFYLFVFLSLAIVIDRRLLPASFAFAASVVASAALPEAVHVFVGVSGMLAALSLTRLWPGIAR